MKQQTPEFSKAASRLTITDIFFTTLLYSLKIEPKDDLPAVAATDGAHLYYHPERFKTELTDVLRVFALVHELMHVILFHSLRRGIRDPELWNIACDRVVNLLCVEYGFITPAQLKQNGWCYDPQNKGMSAEQVYDLLREESGGKNPNNQPGKGKQNSMSGDVMDYDPNANDGKSKGDLEREIGINTEQALQAAKASGQNSARLRSTIGDAQVEREPWYQHLRRYLTSMHARHYNWSRIDSRRAVLHGVICPQQRSEQMGKLILALDGSGSMYTEKQQNAIAAHVNDIFKDVSPAEVIIVYFDSTVCHVQEFTGPDYHIVLEPHGGGGTDFAPIFDFVRDHHSDTQLVMIFTDLYGNFGEGNPVCDTLWLSQTTAVDVPFGEVIYCDLNEG